MYLAPSLVVGLGEWGQAVVARFDRELTARSPMLTLACAALPFSPEEEGTVERLREAIRRSRLAESVRTLQEEGLIQLDPTIAPPTHLYVVVSMEDDPDLAALRETAKLLEQAAQEIRVGLTITALLDIGAGGRVPDERLRFPAYCLQPVTGHGLVLTAEEYRAAVTQALLVLAQPGGSHLLSGRPRLSTFGSLGIAWLDLAPAEVLESVATQMAAEALLLPGKGAEPQAPPPSAPEAATLLDPLWPYRLENGAVVPRQAFRQSFTLQGRMRSVVRAATIAERRVARWSGRMERVAQERVRRQTEGLAAKVTICLGQGIGGLRAAKEMLHDEPALPDWRPDRRTDQGQAADPIGLVRTAKNLPTWRQVGQGTLLLGLLVMLVALLGSWLTYGLAVCALLAIAVGGWSIARPHYQRHLIGRAEAQVAIMEARGLERALRSVTESMAASLAKNHRELLARLERLERELQAAAAGAATAAAPRPGALRYALPVPVDSVLRGVRPHLATLANHLVAANCWSLWHQPDELLACATAEAEAFLWEMAPGPWAGPAWGTSGEEWASQVQGVVGRLLDWSHPLLAESVPEEMISRWRVWPANLPCPNVPREVEVLHGARGVAAIFTVAHLPSSRGAIAASTEPAVGTSEAGRTPRPPALPSGRPAQ